MSINIRIKEERLRLKMSQDQFAIAGGVKKRAQVNYENGIRCPDGHYLSGISQCGADINYIITGIKNLSQVTAAVGEFSIMEISEKINQYDKNDYIAIPHFDIKVAAGSGALNEYENELKPLSFRRDWLTKRRLSPGNLVIVDVTGDSMEPFLKNNDLVLVDRSQINIGNGQTYVIRLDGHLLLKNLELLPRGVVQVSSFNTGFPSYTVDFEDAAMDIAIIGRVVASMHEW